MDWGIGVRAGATFAALRPLPGRGPDTLAIHATGSDPRLLAEHRLARHRGVDQIDQAHCDGLLHGHGRASTLTDPACERTAERLGPVALLLDRPGMRIPVARRDPRVHDAAAGLPRQMRGAA